MTYLLSYSEIIFLDFLKMAKLGYIAIKEHNKRAKTHHGSKRALFILNIIRVPRARCGSLDEPALL